MKDDKRAEKAREKLEGAYFSIPFKQEYFSDVIISDLKTMIDLGKLRRDELDEAESPESSCLIVRLRKELPKCIEPYYLQDVFRVFYEKI